MLSMNKFKKGSSTAEQEFLFYLEDITDCLIQPGDLGKS